VKLESHSPAFTTEEKLLYLFEGVIGEFDVTKAVETFWFVPLANIINHPIMHLINTVSIYYRKIDPMKVFLLPELE